MIPGSERNWIAVNAVRQIQSQQKVKTKNMTTLIVRNSINRPPLRHGLVLITLVLACFGLLPQTQAALPPEIPGNPDGCYPAFNTVEGCNALSGLGPGIGNTGLGWYALGFNFGGSLNTAVGAGALDLNEADANTAVGSAALLLNTIGRGNTAVGAGALALNDGDPSIEDSGSGNTALGAGVLSLNIPGKGSTGVGARALLNNTADGSTAVGVDALTSNTVGRGNTALGAEALKQNTEGSGNTAVGVRTLLNNDGPLNTAVGVNALTANTTGDGNTAVGAGPGVIPQPSPSPHRYPCSSRE